MLKTLHLPKLGAAVLSFLVLLRILGGLVAPQIQILRMPAISLPRQGSILRQPAWIGSAPRPVYTRPPIQTSPPQTVLPTTSLQPTLPSATLPPPPLRPAFSAADAKLIKFTTDTGCPYRPDMGALLEKALRWELASDQPTVLIVHTHATECFQKEVGQDYVNHLENRTLDTRYNMVSIGAALAAYLENAGIRVLHDTTLHDYPSYSDAYNHCRKSVQAYLQQYPSIRLVLDLHRDAATNADGSQFSTGIQANGEKIAQLMFVCGSDRLAQHPQWQENLSLALKLQVLMEQEFTGITRRTLLRNSRFNQDLSPGALLVEFGAAGNTHSEALRAVPVLGEAIAALMHGAN